MTTNQINNRVERVPFFLKEQTPHNHHSRTGNSLQELAAMFLGSGSTGTTREEEKDRLYLLKIS